MPTDNNIATAHSALTVVLGNLRKYEAICSHVVKWNNSRENATRILFTRHGDAALLDDSEPGM